MNEKTTNSELETFIHYLVGVYGFTKQGEEDNAQNCINEAREWFLSRQSQVQADKERAVEEERERIVNNVLYEVNTEKVPTIQDEAWANQFDSKAQAFWYGEAKAIENIKQDLTPEDNQK